MLTDLFKNTQPFNYTDNKFVNQEKFEKFEMFSSLENESIISNQFKKYILIYDSKNHNEYLKDREDYCNHINYRLNDRMFNFSFIVKFKSFEEFFENLNINDVIFNNIYLNVDNLDIFYNFTIYKRIIYIDKSIYTNAILSVNDIELLRGLIKSKFENSNLLIKFRLKFKENTILFMQYSNFDNVFNFVRFFLSFIISTFFITCILYLSTSSDIIVLENNKNNQITFNYLSIKSILMMIASSSLLLISVLYFPAFTRYLYGFIILLLSFICNYLYLEDFDYIYYTFFQIVSNYTVVIEYLSKGYEQLSVLESNVNSDNAEHNNEGYLCTNSIKNNFKNFISNIKQYTFKVKLKKVKLNDGKNILRDSSLMIIDNNLRNEDSNFINLKITSILNFFFSLMILVMYLHHRNYILNFLLCLGICRISVKYLPEFKCYRDIYISLLLFTIYDIYWVYFSKNFFSENLMVLALRQLDYPIKILIPKLITSNDGNNCFVIGLGDIIIPSLVCNYIKKIAFLTKENKLYYFSLRFYFVSIISAGLCNYFFNYPQPALLHIFIFFNHLILIFSYFSNVLRYLNDTNELELNLNKIFNNFKLTSNIPIRCFNNYIETRRILDEN